MFATSQSTLRRREIRGSHPNGGILRSRPDRTAQIPKHPRQEERLPWGRVLPVPPAGRVNPSHRLTVCRPRSIRGQWLTLFWTPRMASLPRIVNDLVGVVKSNLRIFCCTTDRFTGCHVERARQAGFGVPHRIEACSHAVDVVRAVAFRPDGKLLATAGNGITDL